MNCSRCQKIVSKDNFTCQTCVKLFCSDSCLVEHIMNHKNEYFNLYNFEKVKRGSQYYILGAGAFGEVFLARSNIDKKLYAINKVDKAKLVAIGIKPECMYREFTTHMI